MNIDWLSLRTFDDWAGVLQHLLGQARAALESSDANKRAQVQGLLLEFITKSPNSSAAVLDDIAKKAIRDIYNDAVDQALADISSRNAELALHIKSINAVTSDAQAAAGSIRYERATGVINSATSLVQQLNELKNVLSNDQADQALVTKIEKAVKSLQDVVPLAMNVGLAPSS